MKLREERIIKTIENNKNIKIILLKNQKNREIRHGDEILSIPKKLYRSQINPSKRKLVRTIMNVNSKDIAAIDEEVVETAVKEIKLNKARGKDQISVKMTKYGYKYLIKVITQLFNNCAHKSKILVDWAKVLTILVYNKGDKT